MDDLGSYWERFLGVKNCVRGWAAISSKLLEIMIYVEDYESGFISFFKDIDDYMSFRSVIKVGTEHFFLTVTVKARYRSEFLKRQHLRKISFSSVVKSVLLQNDLQVWGSMYISHMYSGCC